MNILVQIFFYYWNLCLLKESPENSPYSLALLGISIFLFTGIMMIQWSLSTSAYDLFFIFIVALSLTLSFILYNSIILFFKGLKSRLVQTSTSLLFAYCIVHVLAMPLVMIDPYITPINLKNPFFLFISILYLFVTLSLSVWQFLITAHIYKFALNTTSFQSVLAAFGLIAVNVLTLSFWR